MDLWLIANTNTGHVLASSHKLRPAAVPTFATPDPPAADPASLTQHITTELDVSAQGQHTPRSASAADPSPSVTSTSSSSLSIARTTATAPPPSLKPTLSSSGKAPQLWLPDLAPDSKTREQLAKMLFNVPRRPVPGPVPECTLTLSTVIFRHLPQSHIQDECHWISFNAWATFISSSLSLVVFHSLSDVPRAIRYAEISPYELAAALDEVVGSEVGQGDGCGLDPSFQLYTRDLHLLHAVPRLSLARLTGLQWPPPNDNAQSLLFAHLFLPDCAPDYEQLCHDMHSLSIGRSNNRHAQCLHQIMSAGYSVAQVHTRLLVMQSHLLVVMHPSNHRGVYTFNPGNQQQSAHLMMSDTHFQSLLMAHQPPQSQYQPVFPQHPNDLPSAFSEHLYHFPPTSQLPLAVALPARPNHEHDPQQSLPPPPQHSSPPAADQTQDQQRGPTPASTRAPAESTASRLTTSPASSESVVTSKAKRSQARRNSPPPEQCLHCGKTESREWRRGPDGSKCLCNACGLRHYRAQRKLADRNSAAVGNTGSVEESVRSQRAVKRDTPPLSAPELHLHSHASDAVATAGTTYPPSALVKTEHWSPPSSQPDESAAPHESTDLTPRSQITQLTQLHSVSHLFASPPLSMSQSLLASPSSIIAGYLGLDVTRLLSSTHPDRPSQESGQSEPNMDGTDHAAHRAADASHNALVRQVPRSPSQIEFHGRTERRVDSSADDMGLVAPPDSIDDHDSHYLETPMQLSTMPASTFASPLRPQRFHPYLFSSPTTRPGRALRGPISPQQSQQLFPPPQDPVLVDPFASMIGYALPSLAPITRAVSGSSSLFPEGHVTPSSAAWHGEREGETVPRHQQRVFLGGQSTE
ncbi:hypothetical protein BCR44DRAFT_55965 [Catenaria anguillulae PL171]|uniref:GATA-type domain-containing protein n=1 Tax=Catenaria anguillulae PL171 TaxID=765915 RepID=A0A1Y2HAD3_9FUNG|nr:hypothetical protein BCR44DRAFT_55965 [Catenaria anguillulae PL171]